MYSQKVMEHFSNPRNVGEIKNADGIGEVGNPVCGDMMTFYIKVKDSRLEDVKFKTFGCGAAISVSSMISEMAKGKTIEEALKITRDDVAKELDGLPAQKMHCSNLGADALHKAIKNYLEKKGVAPLVSEEKKMKGKTKCNCPFCEKPIEEKNLLCNACKVKFKICQHCNAPIPVGADKCIKCGATFEASP